VPNLVRAVSAPGPAAVEGWPVVVFILLVLAWAAVMAVRDWRKK
jgi:hypothetical protein